MARPRQDFDNVGSDSFLDIVANIVGILIILVMVVGARVKAVPSQPPETVEAPTEELEQELAALTTSSVSLESEVLDLDRKREELEAEEKLRRAERDRLALAVEQQRRKIERVHESLDDGQQQGFDAQQKLAAAQQELARLQAELQQAAQAEPQTVQLLSYPTPLSSTVHGKEMHLQLKAGRLAIVPLDDLVEELRSQSKQLIWQLRDLPEVSGMLGPIGGFRMQYFFEKINVPMAVPGSRGRSTVNGGYAQLREFTLIPENGNLGEPFAEALQPQSRFRIRLAGYNQRDATVTVWVYPDSFEEFRTLRKELYRQGYSVAARPLPHGAPIAGSPHGSRSAAQ